MYIHITIFILNFVQVVSEIIKHLHAGQIQLGVNKQSGLVNK